jgi:ABC-type proline/glycine betaine transport system permease subunit
MKTDIGRLLRQEGSAVHRFEVLSQLSYNLTWRGVTMVGTFIAGYGAEMLQRTLQHISMVGIALVLAVSIGMSLGIVISGHERVARWVIGAASVLFTVPSLAPFALLVVALAPIRQGTVLGLVVNDGLLLVEEALTPGTSDQGERK